MAFGEVAYSDYALERFRLLHVPKWTIAAIMQINADELAVPNPPSEIEGWVEGAPGLMWRRAVRSADLEDYLKFEDKSSDEPDEARNFVSIYRWATSDEMIERKLARPALMVVSIVSNLELARYLI